MADLTASVRLINDVAQKAFEKSTGTLKTEYMGELLKASDRLDAEIALHKKDVADLKDTFSKYQMGNRVIGNSKRDAQKADFANLLRAIATKQATPEHGGFTREESLLKATNTKPRP